VTDNNASFTERHATKIAVQTPRIDDTVNTRREFLSHSLAGIGALSLASHSLFADTIASKPLMRFILMHKGNGLLPSSLVPSWISPVIWKNRHRQKLVVCGAGNVTS
jgi:hypothetical protein